MKENLKGWPFLIGSGSVTEVGYDIIVAPEFLCRFKISHLLSDAATPIARNLNSNQVIAIRVLSTEPNLTLVYRIRKATKNYIGLEGEDYLSFRMINIIEGIILFGDYEDVLIKKTVKIDKEEFDSILFPLRNIYKIYWESLTKPSIVCLPSFEIKNEEVQESIETIFKNDYTKTLKRSSSTRGYRKFNHITLEDDIKIELANNTSSEIKEATDSIKLNNEKKMLNKEVSVKKKSLIASQIYSSLKTAESAKDKVNKSYLKNYILIIIILLVLMLVAIISSSMIG